MTIEGSGKINTAYLLMDKLKKVNVEKVTVSEGITQIGDTVFKGTKKLKTVSLPDTLEAIDSSAFELCSELSEITIPDSVTKMGIVLC